MEEITFNFSNYLFVLYHNIFVSDSVLNELFIPKITLYHVINKLESGNSKNIKYMYIGRKLNIETF